MPNCLDLILGQKFTSVLIDTGLRRDGSGRAFVIAGEHNNPLHSGFSDALYYLGDVLTQAVGNTDQPADMVVVADGDDGVACILQFFRFGMDFRSFLTFLMHHAVAADPELPATDTALSAFAANGLKMFGRDDFDARHASLLQDCTRQGMLAGGLQSRSTLQKFQFAVTAERYYLLYLRFTLSECSRLIQGKNLKTARRLKENAALYQHTVTGRCR